MNITSIIQLISAYSLALPFVFSLIYFLKYGPKYDKRINILCVYIILAVGAQALMMYFAMNGKSNLIVIRTFLLIEMFLLGYFLLQLQIKSFLLRVTLATVIASIIFLTDFNWSDFNAIPIESVLLESLIITILGMLAIPSLRVDSTHENSFYYFVFAIMIYSLNNLIGFGFIELAPGFSLFVHAVVNITKNAILSWGLFLVIRNKSR